MAEQCQARGTRGAIAAAAPTAALIGAEALRAGGNAFDAVVAAALAETVLLPPKCGLAGDLVSLAWTRDAPQPEALLAIGGAPAALAELAAKGKLQTTGASSVGVPGAPSGYLALAARGRLPIERLARPAIDLARDGFCWSRICSALSETSRELVAKHNPNGTRYYPDGKVMEPGTVIRLPGLALLLESLVQDGTGFLSGEIGDAIVGCVREQGGVLTKADFVFARAEWLPAVSGTLGTWPLYVTPAPTHGEALLRTFRSLTASTVNPSVAVYAGVMDAIAWYRNELADARGTSMVSAADADGTLVTVVHSNSYPQFGSGLIVDDYDLILANRAGRGYSSDPKNPNFPVAGRRPATTLHAWAVRPDQHSRLQGATPGGANQMPWNAQTLARLLGGETDIGRLIVAPRWEWRPVDNSLRVEAGFSTAELDALRSVTDSIEPAHRWATSSAMQILAIDESTRILSAAADPRTVGSALAF